MWHLGHMMGHFIYGMQRLGLSVGHYKWGVQIVLYHNMLHLAHSLTTECKFRMLPKFQHLCSMLHEDMESMALSSNAAQLTTRKWYITISVWNSWDEDDVSSLEAKEDEITVTIFMETRYTYWRYTF